MALNEIVLPDGERVKLGNVPPPAGRTKGVWQEFGTTPEQRLIPRSEWDGLLAQYAAGPDHQFLPPVHNQNGVGQCFPKGTLVRMADGSQRPIEDVKVLEEVLTAEGRVKPVLRTMVRQADSLVRVQAHGLRHLRCTEEHPVLTARGYVKAGDLNRDDYLAIPRYAPESVAVVQTADHCGGRVYTNRQATHNSRVYGVAGRKAVVVTRCGVPDAIHLTRDFGWIVGLYLAEGFTGHGKAEWALNVNETDTTAAKLIRCIRDCFGAEAVIRKVGGKSTNAIKVTLYGVQWAKLFESLCAAGSGRKRAHADLTSGPREFLAGVLEGWTDGDGLGPTRNGGVTVSHTLAVQMFDIANAMGKRPTIETLDVKTYGQVASRQKRYQVRWGEHPDRPDYRSRQDDTHLWRRVDGVVREEFTGWVYNLEVADDNSYVAEGVGVHNCNADDTTALVEFCRGMQGLPYVQLSAADLYHRINGGRDQGSMLEDAMAEIMARGVGTAATCGTLWKRGEFKGEAGPAERLRFRVLEAYLCPTFDHCFSASLQGFGLSTGIPWYDNYTPDADGWLPRPAGDSGGHAIMGYKPAKRGTSYGIWHQNSWGKSWGLQGRFVIPESAYRNGSVGGWWASRGVVDEGGIVPAEVV